MLNNSSAVPDQGETGWTQTLACVQPKILLLSQHLVYLEHLSQDEMKEVGKGSLWNSL